jgi:hypothetical protein
MTADDATPSTGQDGTGIGRESFPLRGATDAALSDAVMDARNEAREATGAVSRALLNEDVPLRDDDVEQLAAAGDTLAALSRTLALRADRD